MREAMEETDSRWSETLFTCIQTRVAIRESILPSTFTARASGEPIEMDDAEES